MLSRFSFVMLFIFTAAVFLAGCAEKNNNTTIYRQITQQEARQMMDEQDVLILDVREQHEYDSGHIPGAILLPVGTITEETAAQIIAAKDTVVLIYCRNGNRSKQAAAALADLGYTELYEFGGISTWPYEVE